MKRRQDPKIKLTVYVNRATADRLDLVCRDRSKNKSKLTEAALAQLLNPTRGQQEEAAIPRRLDKLSRDISLIHRHQQIVTESLGMFIRHYLVTSPPLPQSDHQAAQALGNQRFERFIAQLGKRLAGSQSLADEIAGKLANHNHNASSDALVANGTLPAAADWPLKS
jgi:hypothetical protein